MKIDKGAACFFCLFWTCALPDVYGSRDSTSSLLRWKLHLQSRFSFVKGQPLSFWGASAGYTWGPYEREVTLGYQWMGGRGARQWAHIEQQRAQDLLLPIYPRSEAGFVNLGYWHILHNSRRWKAGIPLEIGFGKAHTEYYSRSLDRPLLLSVPQTSRIAPAQLGGYVEWKATRWVGLGIQSGYRYNLLRNRTPDTFDGLYYRFRVLVYPAAYREGFRFVFRGQPLPSPFFREK